MLLHYIKVALRNLGRNPLHTGINLLGLSFGIAACLLIIHYVEDELTYDRFQEKGDRLYRLSNIMDLSGTQNHVALTGLAIGPRVLEDYPEVESICRFMSYGEKVTVKKDDKIFSEENLYFVDSTAFDLLTYSIVKGQQEGALARPKTAVISAKMAQKYFGHENPIGQFLEINTTSYEVTGVFALPPGNTDLPFQALVSLSTLSPERQEAFARDWFRMVAYTFVLFKEERGAVGFEEKLEQVVEQYVKPFMAANDVEGNLVYQMTPLKELHLRNDLNYDTPKGNKAYLYIFSAVAFFILLIACINYINLSIATSVKRSKEVGIRKVAGAHTGSLMPQFLGESLLLTLFALVIAVLLVQVMMPVMGTITGKAFTGEAIFRPALVVSMVGILFVVGLLAGSYPAFYLSNIRPVQVLKGQKALSRKSWLRQVLVVAQFSISIGLIISTLMVYGQMRYMQTHELGFEGDQVWVVHIPSADTTVARSIKSFAQDLEQLPGVKGTSITGWGSTPGRQTAHLLFRAERDSLLEETGFNVMAVDEKFFDLLGIELMEGRNFDPSRGTETGNTFIVNEEVITKQGWKEPIGRRLQWGLGANQTAQFDGQVVGVVKNFHYTSLHNPIDPLVIFFWPDQPSRLYVKMEGGQIHATHEELLRRWQEFSPNHPVQSFFLDSFFDQQYESERRLMQIFAYFAGLTVLIACMGLFGLSSYMTQQRIKEIGIRKVMGAETRQILMLLGKDISFLVVIAIFLASIGAAIGISYWLEDFAYQVPFNPSFFFLAGLLSLVIAWLTIIFHTWRAARSNPVKALRYE